MTLDFHNLSIALKNNLVFPSLASPSVQCLLWHLVRLPGMSWITGH